MIEQNLTAEQIQQILLLKQQALNQKLSEQAAENEEFYDNPQQM